MQFISSDIAYKAFSIGNRCSGVGVSTTFNGQGMRTTMEFRDSFDIEAFKLGVDMVQLQNHF